MDRQHDDYADELSLRRAIPEDLSDINALIDRSVRALSVGYYSAAQVEGALRHVFGADTQLVLDGTYYVIESPTCGLAAAGGWSRRKTLYGGDQAKAAADPLLDPDVDPARIRAFFVDPSWARRGLGRHLFEACAAAAAEAGFRDMELMATLPGVPFYQALGFTAVEQLIPTLPDGQPFPVVRMTCPVPAATRG